MTFNESIILLKSFYTINPFSSIMIAVYISNDTSCSLSKHSNEFLYIF